MKRVAALVVFMSAVAAQAQESAHQKHLQMWAEDFAGQWVSESVADADFGPLKTGDKFTAYHSYEWSPDKEALYLKYSAEVGGKTFDTTKGIAGWDASKNVIVVRWFDSLGASGEFSFVKKGQEWISEWTSTDGKGRCSVWTGTAKVTPDSQQWRMTNRKTDGVAQPDSDTTWKRNT